MADSADRVVASGQTDATCREAGPYRSSSQARLVVFLKSGDKFPVDSSGARTTWTLLTEDNSM